MPTHTDTPDSMPSVSTQGNPLMDAFKLYLPLLPCILGLTFSRAGVIVAAYGSYSQTDDGIFTDGSMLVSLSIMAILLFIIVARKALISKSTVNRLMRIAIVLEAGSSLALAAMAVVGYHNEALRFALCVVCTFFGSYAISYWLRRARGSSTFTAAVFVFSALFFSEIINYVCGAVPLFIGYALGGVLILIQFPCILWARKQQDPFAIQSSTQSDDYFGFAKTMVSNKRFLSVTAVGVILLSIVIGFLRGYPNGMPIAFTPPARIAYMILTMGICVCVIVCLFKGRRSVMTIKIWIILQALACAALVSYALFPENLAIGAVFTTTLNALMMAFVWYVVIAFMSYGWREPFYYAITGWLVFLGTRAVIRVGIMIVQPTAHNDLVPVVVMGALLLIAAQVVFVQFIGIARQVLPDQAEESKDSTLHKLLGIDDHESFSNMRQTSMQHNAEELGKQFLLSDREIEVLTLYALGHTQKRVAEDLYITAGTAHAHIKRIYSKTGLHSRQEILDYMAKYTS